MLRISERDIRRAAGVNPFSVLLRQWRTERGLHRRGLRFRDIDAAAVARVYAAMTPSEFEGINARQDWANRRTIPRCLNGNVPDRPVRVLDLGCGSGSSTAVLAFWCPAGSHLTGYEIAEPLVEIARKRCYLHRGGGSVRVDFVVQGVSATWREPNGTPVAEGAVDLVNASGVVGHHLTPATFGPVLAELRRVLRTGGIACLDVGPTFPKKFLIEAMTADGWTTLGHHRSWWGDPTGEAVFRRPGRP